MGTSSLFLSKRIRRAPKMPVFSRLPTDEFNADISAAAMDSRFIVIGEDDGEVAACFASNGSMCFKTKVSDAKITAVCADLDQDLFYAGDADGKVFVLNKKGEVLNEAEMPEERAGPVLMIISNKNDVFRGGNTTGFAIFKNATSEIEISLEDKSKFFSLDGDGTLYDNKDDGIHELFGYNARSSAAVNATVALTEGKVAGNYPTFSNRSVAGNEAYQADVDQGRAITTLSIRKSENKSLGNEIKKLEFEVPVKQVMSCRHHLDDAEADDVYILLCDGHLKKVNGTQLFDEEVAAEDLEMEDIVDEYDGEEETEKYLGGFAVYGKRCVVFGSSGLYVADLE